MPFDVHHLGPDDVALLEGINALFAAAFEDSENYASARPTADYLRRLLGDPTFVALAAIAQGEVIGALAAYELRKFEQERSEFYIYDLAVHAMHRREGVATALIAALQEIAADRGGWVIFVQADTGVEDEPAIALYTKLGTREEVLHFDIPVPGGVHPQPRPAEPTD
jgi:aminoglycoside 3-N-acetyltransferase I